MIMEAEKNIEGNNMGLYGKGEPWAIDVKSGEAVYICQCGKTSNPPFCDGSHQGTDFTPLAFTPDKDDTIYVCGCGKSANKPWCDGSHNR